MSKQKTRQPMKIITINPTALKYTPLGKPDKRPAILVHTLTDNLHIGTIHFSAITDTYEYYPNGSLLMQYTDTMLESIARIISIANDNTHCAI